MPSFVPRGREPHQKRELVEKRVAELRLAIQAGEPNERLHRLAERVRAAQLTMLKGWGSILDDRRIRLSGRAGNREQWDDLDRRAAKLALEITAWKTRPAPEIVADSLGPSEGDPSG